MKPGSARRARRRFHRDRIVAKRKAQYVHESGQDWAYVQQAIAEGRDPYMPPMDDGLFENEQPHMGCRRAHCGMCSRSQAERKQARRKREREARRIEEAAY